ncbi:hypothetical protein SAMN04487948_102372 [Halogranum amylolyticum]|uniref:Uncharacterized protein n=1 Tax=Halogranum amylolyticum TaxID=660520 RepID=A0A1H8PLN0_9EURY|nr:hypothetical protein [Halogranum amylolyticum]SEO42691.1 hypothetical protein SAMN04487948_102372 [Halogranum amylolyticum]
MVPSPFDGRRDLDATDVVAAVGLCCCVLFESLAILDRIVGTDFWPTDFGFGVNLFVFGSLYGVFLRRLALRERRLTVGFLTVAVCAMVAAAYTNPEGPLMPVVVVSLLVAGVVGGKGVVESLGTSRSTGH